VANASATMDPLFLMPTGDGFIMLAATLTATPETVGTHLSAPTTKHALRSALLTELTNKLGKEPMVFKPTETL
jgi:hypothetical protein